MYDKLPIKVASSTISNKKWVTEEKNKMQRELEQHAVIRESIEMQKLLQNKTKSCFEACCSTNSSFLTGTVSDQERKCLRNCSTRFWDFFNRAQGVVQDLQLKQIEAINKQ